QQPAVAPAIAGRVTPSPTPGSPTSEPAATPGSPAAPPTADTPPPLPGRVASSVPPQRTDWLLAPYFPFGCLSLIVGVPGSGKSTLAAYLMLLAERVVLLAGHEEDTARMWVPRMAAAGVCLDNVRILDTGDWSMPGAQDRIRDVVTRWRAKLLIADPID